MTLPEITTPGALAEHLGWPERRVRRIARALGACLVSGDSTTGFRLSGQNVKSFSVREEIGAISPKTGAKV